MSCKFVVLRVYRADRPLGPLHAYIQLETAPLVVCLPACVSAARLASSGAVPVTYTRVGHTIYEHLQSNAGNMAMW